MFIVYNREIRSYSLIIGKTNHKDLTSCGFHQMIPRIWFFNNDIPWTESDKVLTTSQKPQTKRLNSWIHLPFFGDRTKNESFKNMKKIRNQGFTLHLRKLTRPQTNDSFSNKRGILCWQVDTFWAFFWWATWTPQLVHVDYLPFLEESWWKDRKVY